MITMRRTSQSLLLSGQRLVNRIYYILFRAGNPPNFWADSDLTEESTEKADKSADGGIVDFLRILAIFLKVLQIKKIQ